MTELDTVVNEANENRKQQQQEYLNKFIRLINFEYGIKEVSTPKQKSNGTVVLELPNGDLIGSYKSGYVRRCDRNRTVYQINKTYIQEQRYTILSGTSLKTIKSNYKVRELIFDPLARLAYIVEFYKRNYLNNKQNTITQG